MEFLKNNKRFILCFISTLLWTFLVFSLSLQTAEESSELSGGIVAWLVSDVLGHVFGEIPNLEHWVRKAAHFTEYFLLGVLTYTTVLEKNRTNNSFLKGKQFFVSTMIYCVLVATTDETIQRFVSGRSGQLSDVFLDSAGAFCGIVVINCKRLIADCIFTVRQ